MTKKGGTTLKNPFADGNPNLEVPLPLWVGSRPTVTEEMVIKQLKSTAMRQMIWRQLNEMERSSLWRASFGDYSLLARRLQSGCELTAAERRLAADVLVGKRQPDPAWQAKLDKWKNSVFAVVKFVLEHEAATGKRECAVAAAEKKDKFSLSRSTIFAYLAELEKKGRVSVNDRKEELRRHGTLDAFVAEKWVGHWDDDAWDDDAIIAAAVEKFGVDRDEAELALREFVSEFAFNLEPPPDYNPDGGDDD
jgi:hypothetical protein